MPLLPFVWDGRVGAGIRKAPTPVAHSWKPPRQRRRQAAQPRLLGHRALVLGLPRGARTFGKVRGHSPRPHFPPRVTGPSHAGRPPPRRGHQTVRAAPPGRLRARIPPPAPPPAGAPLGPQGSPSPAGAAGYRPQPGGSPGGRTEREDVARTEVASGEAGSVLERPGRGQGAGTAPGAAGPDPPREHLGVRGPGPPPPGAERRPQLPAPLRTPALLPPPYGNLQPLKVTRRRFLGLSARPPPPGQRSCRGDSGRGSGFLGQNLLGRMGRARGGGRAREPLPGFFIKKNLPASFPPPSRGKLGGRAGNRSPARCGPKVEAKPPPGPRVPGVPRRARGAPAVWRQVFPGKPGAPGALRDRIALRRTQRPAGAFQRAGPSGRGAGSRSPPVSRSCTPYLLSG
ncbi:collagen alpha-1(I) chain-like [Ursus maritimus]|uniref:Collagen alpha-1(I) chain-like n=1 Tax=Ursus maritimus TaxID=29073 RepID=A0A8M1F6A9_URSMA|nr:collagen alpha-1(I) chain-like [Ursus maritimus]